jgi:hypothetical protein
LAPSTRSPENVLSTRAMYMSYGHKATDPGVKDFFGEYLLCWNIIKEEN